MMMNIFTGLMSNRPFTIEQIAKGASMFKDERGNIHPRDGLIFRKLRQLDGTNEYETVELNQQFYDNLVDFVKGGYQKPYTGMLVRYMGKDSDNYNYFPLPMLYVSKARRYVDSTRKGRRPRPESWIHAMRDEIRHELELMGVDTTDLQQLERQIDTVKN